MLTENVWINVRAEAADGKDSKVKNIFNFNLLNSKLEQIINSDVLTKELENYLGDKVILKTCSLQIDEPDTRTKRSWHVDRNPPPTFKAFIYLTDVDSDIVIFSPARESFSPTLSKQLLSLYAMLFYLSNQAYGISASASREALLNGEREVLDDSIESAEISGCSWCSTM